MFKFLNRNSNVLNLSILISTQENNEKNKKILLSKTLDLIKEYAGQNEIEKIEVDGNDYKNKGEVLDFKETIFYEYEGNDALYFTINKGKGDIIMDKLEGKKIERKKSNLSLSLNIPVEKHQVGSLSESVRDIYREIKAERYHIGIFYNVVRLISNLRKKISDFDINIFDGILKLEWIQVYPKRKQGKLDIKIYPSIKDDFYLNLPVYKTRILKDGNVYVQLTEEVFDANRKEHVEVAKQLYEAVKEYRKENRLTI